MVIIALLAAYIGGRFAISEGKRGVRTMRRTITQQRCSKERQRERRREFENRKHERRERKMQKDTMSADERLRRYKESCSRKA